ncbi:MAG: biotin-dependent carboxyltransferase family protein [Flaviaesturariibacter sp.]|nr:biotin-dependent carboxyltransferase family protein [Flaviaesturariibacter sp.]
MSITIIKEGLLDTIQDGGRPGLAHLGIGPGGPLDPFSARLGNALLGNDLFAAQLELHVPAATLRIDDATFLVVTGAGQIPYIDGREMPMNQPFFAQAGSSITWSGTAGGRCSYLSFIGGLQADQWLGSAATNLRLPIPGLCGRALRRGDRIVFHASLPAFRNRDTGSVLPWTAAPPPAEPTPTLLFLPGHEWSRLPASSQAGLAAQPFSVTNQSDRMGFRLEGPAIHTDPSIQLVSSPVAAGTMQLLPNGQLIVLMADHQTTGGYPRVGHIISAQLHKLAQLPPGRNLVFAQTDLATADRIRARQDGYLLQLKNACTFRIQTVLNDAG